MNIKCFLFTLSLFVGFQLIGDETKQYLIKYENNHLLISYPSSWNAGDDFLPSGKKKLDESIAKLNKDGILFAYVIFLSQDSRLSIAISSEKEIVTKDKLQNNLQNMAKIIQENTNIKLEDIETKIGSGLYYSAEVTIDKQHKKTISNAKEYKYNTMGSIYISEIKASLTFTLLHDQQNPENALNIIKNINLVPAKADVSNPSSPDR